MDEDEHWHLINNFHVMPPMCRLNTQLEPWIEKKTVGLCLLALIVQCGILSRPTLLSLYSDTSVFLKKLVFFFSPLDIRPTDYWEDTANNLVCTILNDLMILHVSLINCSATFLLILQLVVILWFFLSLRTVEKVWIIKYIITISPLLLILIFFFNISVILILWF
jgi:hypothetical protein